MASDLKTLTVEIVSKVGVIKFSRPDQMNSFIKEQYGELGTALQDLDANNKVSCILLTGSAVGTILEDKPKRCWVFPQKLRALITKNVNETAKVLLETLIKLKKPIIGAVNGPALGVAVTTLALMDIVYCSDTATFTTPFMKLGFCAEGCSSILFPRIMGPSKANELLLLGKQMTAQEAEQCGFVAKVFPANTLYEEALKIAKQMAEYPPGALRTTKGLVQEVTREELLKVNEREMTTLVECFLSDESITAVMKFMASQRQKKAKL